MIKGLLGELAPEVEITRAQSNMDEEGSSSTPGKEYIKDDNATNEDQFVNASSQQKKFNMNTKINKIEVDESTLERGLEEETVSLIEDEVQGHQPSPVSAQRQPPAS